MGELLRPDPGFFNGDHKKQDPLSEEGHDGSTVFLKNNKGGESRIQKNDKSAGSLKHDNKQIRRTKNGIPPDHGSKRPSSAKERLIRKQQPLIILFVAKPDINHSRCNKELFKIKRFLQSFNEADSSSYQLIKRSFDIAVGLLGITILLPTALAIKLMYVASNDHNSIFLIQKRIGKDGKEFNLIKFRTMIPNADKVLRELLKKNKHLAIEYKKNKKIKNDPRITKAGKLLRRTSIDELPQMLCIFSGDMSLIGNRPYLPREKKHMGKYFQSIVSTKPGLTGLWQVNGRSNLSFKKRLIYEKHYSKHCGIMLDTKIFLKTFKVVFLRMGAE